MIIPSISYSSGAKHLHLSTTSRKTKGSTGVRGNPITRRTTSKTYITNPTEYDVLCIKDKTWARHTGNRIYRERVLELANHYDVASKQDKMKLTRSIVQLMQQKYNARFLRQVDHNVWEVITDKQARDKTSHALRFAAKTSSAKSNGTTPTPLMTISNDDNETIVSTSTMSRSTQPNVPHGRYDSVEDCDEDDDDRIVEEHEETETIVSNEEQDEDDDEEEETNVNFDDSFVRKCAVITDIDPRELVTINSSDHTDYGNDRHDATGNTSFDDRLFRQQQSRLQSMQRQYLDQCDEAAAVPEEILSTSCRRSEATMAFLDMSLSSDDMFSLYLNDPVLGDATGGGDFGYGTGDQHYDDLQLEDLLDRY